MRTDNQHFINFKFAKVCDGQRIEVVYYVLHPVSKKLVRKRVSSMPYKTKKDNLRHAQKMAHSINNKLEEGWNPFLDGKKSIKLIEIETAFDNVLKLKNAIVEHSTFRTYKSRIKIFQEWLADNGWLQKLTIEITPEIAQKFSDYLMVEKEITARTHNNYINDFINFFNALKKRNYISINPFQEISLLQTTEKMKEHLSDAEFELLKNELPNKSKGFQICCKLTYYCAIRNNEISKLKIKDLNLDQKFIRLDGSTSKVKRIRTIPIIDDGFIEDLRKFTKGFSPNSFLVSNNFLPGNFQDIGLSKKLSNHFGNLAKKLNFRKGVTYYSLKDTLAAQLAKEKVNIKVIQLLLGHSNISMTENYLTKYSPDLTEHIKGKIKLLS